MEARVDVYEERPASALAARLRSALCWLGLKQPDPDESRLADESRLVREAMSGGVASIDPAEAVACAAERLAEQDVGVLAVCRGGGRLEGVITDRDIVVRIVAQGADPDRLTVGECQTAEPVTVSPHETLAEAARRMDEHEVRRLPVTQGGRLVGIISQADLAAHGAHDRAGRLLERMARLGGDRRSARWLLAQPYPKDR